MGELDKCTKSLKHAFISPDPRLQAQRRFCANEIAGSIELAAMRGHQVGIHDAYKVIRRSDPKAAAKILKRYNMSKDGSIGGA